VAAARKDTSIGATSAVLSSDLPALHRALLRAADTRPDLRLRPYLATRSGKPVALGSVTLRDLEQADRIKIGSCHEISDYPIGLDGYLTLLFVRLDPDRRRHLALHERADRVDWTELFRDAAEGSAPAPQPAVGSPVQHSAAPVDVVYTWVDALDPSWLAQHAHYSTDHVALNASANNSERYIDREELRYSLRSVWMFAPFVRNIYLVTADQQPDWLLPHPKITLVSHRDLFPDTSVMPTFNSHAIEACLHRIPDLAENFLYFNDDVFLGREVRESDFFTLAGLTKVRLSPSAFIYGGTPEPGAIPTDWAAYNSVSLIERDFAITFDRRLQHVPLPLKRSVLTEIEQRYSDEVSATRKARFRSTSDVAIPSMFGQYYAIASRHGVEWPHGPDEYVYLNTGRANARQRYESIMSRHPKFFCLNATRYEEIGLDEQAARLRDFVEVVFPSPAPWEKAG
jgi:hypothetical protein